LEEEQKTALTKSTLMGELQASVASLEAKLASSAAMAAFKVEELEKAQEQSQQLQSDLEQLKGVSSRQTEIHESADKVQKLESALQSVLQQREQSLQRTRESRTLCEEQGCTCMDIARPLQSQKDGNESFTWDVAACRQLHFHALAFYQTLSSNPHVQDALAFYQSKSSTFYQSLSSNPHLQDALVYYQNLSSTFYQSLSSNQHLQDALAFCQSLPSNPRLQDAIVSYQRFSSRPHLQEASMWLNRTIIEYEQQAKLLVNWAHAHPNFNHARQLISEHIKGADQVSSILVHTSKRYFEAVLVVMLSTTYPWSMLWLMWIIPCVTLIVLVSTVPKCVLIAFRIICGLLSLTFRIIRRLLSSTFRIMCQLLSSTFLIICQLLSLAFRIIHSLLSLAFHIIFRFLSLPFAVLRLFVCVLCCCFCCRSCSRRSKQSGPSAEHFFIGSDDEDVTLAEKPGKMNDQPTLKASQQNMPPQEIHPCAARARECVASSIPSKSDAHETTLQHGIQSTQDPLSPQTFFV